VLWRFPVARPPTRHLNIIPLATSCFELGRLTFCQAHCNPSCNLHVCMCNVQIAGVRSNLWPGAFCAIQGTRFTNIYVGWGIKNAPFLPLPPPPVAQEYDQTMVESVELPPKYKPEAEAEPDADE
jgi:hypothetical protein